MLMHLYTTRKLDLMSIHVYHSNLKSMRLCQRKLYRTAKWLVDFLMCIETLCFIYYCFFKSG